MVNLVKKALQYEERTNGLQPSCFISIPLNLGDQMTLRYEGFKKQVRKLIPTLDERTFMPIPKLHLTVSVHYATDAEGELERLKEIMNQYAPKHLPSLTIHRLGIMKGSESSCRVLYAQVKEYKCLDILFRPLLEALVEADLGASLSTKWHCTLMNSKYADQKPFDVRDIMKRLGEHFFATIEPKELHLASMIKPADGDGNYHSEHVIPLNHGSPTD